MSGVMPQIETVVMLMLENRSLDTVLGWLHDGRDDLHAVPVGSGTTFRGIRNGMSNEAGPGPLTYSYEPARGTQGWPQPLRVPRADPGEFLRDLHRQMYGDANDPATDLGWGDDAPMAGFAASYASPWRAWDQAGEVMGAYTGDQLPVLYGLAENFAVSDAWFASVPTATDPNRAFSLCGTSLGATGDVFPRHYDAPTIFNGLDEAGVDWGIYWQYNGLLDGDLDVTDRRCWTVDRFPRIGQSLSAGNGAVAHYSELFRRLEEGTLPSFTYVEPYWGWGLGPPDGDDFVGLQGNDYHPPTWVGPAENDLNELYEALKHSAQWTHMLFIITFDENGGTWDHVSPPAAPAPDDSPSDAPPFDFTRLGPRVPALLVSPYVVPGTVFRPPASGPQAFDHSSVIATVLAWAGTSADFIGTMGRRVADAPRFDHALSDLPHLDNRPSFTVPPEYRDQGGPKGPHGFPFDATGLGWDAIRHLADDLARNGGLTSEKLIDVVRDHLTRSRPPTA